MWFTETGADKIGRMTPDGVLTEFALPAVAEPAGSTGPQPGPDGDHRGAGRWRSGSRDIPGEVGRITTAGVVTEFAVPAIPPPAGSPAGTASTPAMLTAITAGPDGCALVHRRARRGGPDQHDGVVTEFAVPEIPPAAGSPQGRRAPWRH